MLLIKVTGLQIPFRPGKNAAGFARSQLLIRHGSVFRACEDLDWKFAVNRPFGGHGTFSGVFGADFAAQQIFPFGGEI
jgi:hypothetical protein